MKRRLSILTVMVVVAIFAAIGCAGTEKKPVPENDNTAKTPKYSTLMAAAEADPYKNGCVSCHTKKGDVDRSLPTYVKKIEGHPQVNETTVNACYVCHEQQKKPELYKKFVRGMHKTHWKSSIFYQKQNGQCYSCHSVESNGVSGIKEYPLAGYRTIGATKTDTSAKAEPKIKTQPQTKAQPKTETKQEEAEQEQGEEQAPQQNGEENRSEGLAVPQSGDAVIELPVPTP